MDPASVRISVDVRDDAPRAARRAAALLATACRDSVRARGSCEIAVSGGTTPWAMFAALADEDVPWSALGIWQVDERIAPRGHEDRGLTHLLGSLPEEGRPHVRPMPVDEVDPGDDAALEAAARTYAATLPERFDVVHLGLGADGHTASLVPGDPVLDVADRDVASTDPYQGRRRMTLTFPALDRARQILWVATGASKARPVRMLVQRDQSIPASRVAAGVQDAVVDRAAAGPSDIPRPGRR
ncbi:MAG: 6-phosphogluconolactonase [Actinomycetota bacterium]